MIQPGVYNIKLQRRADYSVLLEFRDSNQTPVNLVGWTALCQVWNQARTTKYADFTVTYTNRAQGQLRLSLSHVATSALPNETVYDVLLIDASGHREYYLEGTITAEEGYTSAS